MPSVDICRHMPYMATIKHMKKKASIMVNRNLTEYLKLYLVQIYSIIFLWALMG